MSDAPQNPVAPTLLAPPLLVIHNVHIPNCGTPPSVEFTKESKEYVGYFENFHGEQWVLAYDYDSETGILRGGDAGWESRYLFVEGKVPGVTTNQEERAWLTSCWLALTLGRKVRDERRYKAGTSLEKRPRTVWRTTTLDGEPIELAQQAGRCYLDGELLVAFYRQSDKAEARVQTTEVEVTLTHEDFDRLVSVQRVLR